MPPEGSHSHIPYVLTQCRSFGALLWKRNHLLLCDKRASESYTFTVKSLSHQTRNFIWVGELTPPVIVTGFKLSWENFSIPGCMCTYAMEILLTESFSFGVGLLTIP